MSRSDKILVSYDFSLSDRRTGPVPMAAVKELPQQWITPGGALRRLHPQRDAALVSSGRSGDRDHTAVVRHHPVEGKGGGGGSRRKGEEREEQEKKKWRYMASL